MGIELGPDDVAFRCNLVTLDDANPPTMVDFAAGHPTSEQSAPIIAALDAELGGGRDGVRFYPGVEYRHLCVVPRALGDAECVPPHDLTGKPAVFPVGAAAEKLIALMDASKPIVAEHAAAGRLDRVTDLAVGSGRPARPAGVRAAIRRGRPAHVGRRSRARARRAHRARSPRRARRHRRVRQRLRRATGRRSGIARRPRLLPAARRGDRRGRAPGRRSREGRRTRAMGPRHHRPAHRSTRRGGVAVPHPADAGPRDPVRDQDPHLRARFRTSCSTRRATRRVGSTRRSGSRTPRSSSRTRSCAACSRPADEAGIHGDTCGLSLQTVGFPSPVR